RVVAQKIVDQRKLPQRVGIIERSQFPPRCCALDPGLKRWGFANTPSESWQGREYQSHQAVRSTEPLRIALLTAATSRLPLLWKNRFTSWLSIAETLITI